MGSGSTTGRRCDARQEHCSRGARSNTYAPPKAQRRTSVTRRRRRRALTRMHAGERIQVGLSGLDDTQKKGWSSVRSKAGLPGVDQIYSSSPNRLRSRMGLAGHGPQGSLRFFDRSPSSHLETETCMCRHGSLGGGPEMCSSFHQDSHVRLMVVRERKPSLQCSSPH
jgi:hypothetical protein